MKAGAGVLAARGHVGVIRSAGAGADSGSGSGANASAATTAKPSASPRRGRVLAGFGPALGITVTWLSLIVLIPLSAVLFKTATLGWASFWATVTAPRVLASYRLSFGAALLAAAIDTVFGLLLAWSLTRYSFLGKKLVDALIDLPFALPTAVAGIALTALYAGNGWLGSLLEPLGVKVAFRPLGVLVALVFVGVPFVVRTVQPVLEEIDTELEEAAASLGAGRWQSFRLVVLPMLAPALLTGFALAFARGVGEYGSVIFIAGNLPGVSEIAPLMIISKLEQFDYAGATAIAVVMLVASFLLLLGINGLQAWSARARGTRPRRAGSRATARTSSRTSSRISSPAASPSAAP